MRSFLLALADALDAIAMICAVAAIPLVFYGLRSVETGPELIQMLLLGLTLAVVPYCLAGALGRICARF